MSGRSSRAARAAAAVCAALLGAAPGAARAGQIDTATFFQIRRGMSESEVLVRAGRPDLVTSPGARSTEIESSAVVPRDDGGFDVERRRSIASSSVSEWHYVPDRGEHDPFLTVITFRRGEVWEIERTKIFTRDHLPEPPAPDAAAAGGRAALTDDEVRIRRLERTIRAAREYAETRARIKERAAAHEPGTGAGAERPIYRSRAEEGPTYYGDRPPGDETPIVDVD